MRQIPNLFTLLNLFFGCLAIVCVLQTGLVINSNEYGEQLIDIPEKIWMASLFIGLAGLIDFLDGFVARLLKASSEMGKQLDSLADVVSFGVAPGMILYQFLRLSFAKEPNGLDTSIAWLLPAFIIPCAAAYRLAKFNIDDSQQYGFKGVPTPAVGLLIASFPLIYWFTNNQMINTLFLNKWFLYGVIVVLSYLMVSNIPIMALKFKDYSAKNNIPKIVLIILTLIMSFLLKWVAIPVVFIAYIIISLALKNKTQ